MDKTFGLTVFLNFICCAVTTRQAHIVRGVDAAASSISQEHTKCTGVNLNLRLGSLYRTANRVHSARRDFLRANVSQVCAQANAMISFLRNVSCVNALKSFGDASMWIAKPTPREGGNDNL